MSRVSFAMSPMSGLSLIGVVLLLASGLRPVQAQTVTILHNFAGATDGAQPFGSLMSDRAGNLYGTTNHGGVQNPNCSFNGTGCGTVFALKQTSSGWSYKVIYQFGGYPVDAASPVTGSLISDKQGNLYGTTMLGGTASCEESQGCGTVFKLSPSPTGWKESLVYNFSSDADGLFWPRSGVVFKHGNFYGTAFNGGLLFGGAFEVSPSGVESVLYNFPGGTYGSNPYGGVVFDNIGNLYGTTPYGGLCCGTVFQIATDGSEKILYNFSGGADGNTPWAGLVIDRQGNLYGTTFEGGGTGCGGLGCGTVFQLAPDGTETVLHTFDSTDGAAPWGGVILDAKGNLYGMTSGGGAHDSGTVFVLKRTAGGWKERVLHDFNIFDGSDGAYPQGSLFLQGGMLYGTTQWGGTNGQGTVFQLNPNN